MYSQTEPTPRDKIDLVERAKALYLLGNDEQSALNAIGADLRSGLFTSFTNEQAAHAVRVAYAHFAKYVLRTKVKVPAAPAPANETDAALALYRSLIALGWTPPA